jgi:hypothetical protein
VSPRDLPVAAVNFANAVRSGVLRPEHVFYQLVEAGSSLFSGSQSASAHGFWEQFPALMYLAGEARTGGIDMLRGYGWAGNRRADAVPDPTLLLVPLPSTRQLARSDMPVTTTPGPDTHAVHIGLQLCISAGWPALRHGRCAVYHAALITDGKSVSAGVRQHMGQVVGLVDEMPHAEVLRILEMEPEAQTDALEEILGTRLTSTVQEFLLMPSAAGRAPLRLGFHAAEENNAMLRTTQLAEMREAAASCFRCLELECECILSPSKPSDATPLARFTRPCEGCAAAGGDEQCTRFWTWTSVMDCGAVNQSLLTRIRDESGGLFGPASGILHFLKKIRNFAFRWWMWYPGRGYVCLHMLTWLWSAEDPSLREAWRTASPVAFVFNPQMMLSDSLVQMWCRQEVCNVLEGIRRDHGGALVRVLPYAHSRFPLPQHDSLGRFEGLVLSEGGERLLLADAEASVLVEVTLHGIATLETVLGVDGKFGKATGAKPFVLGTRQLHLSRPGAMCIIDGVVVVANRHGGTPSNLICIDGWWPARLGIPPPRLVSVVPLDSVPFSIAPVGKNQLLMTLIDKPSTVLLFELIRSAVPALPRVASGRKVLTSAQLLRSLNSGPERVRGVCLTTAWGGLQAVVLDALAMGGGRLWLWNFSDPNAEMMLIDQGAELGQPHSIVETAEKGVFVITNWKGNQLLLWRKPLDDDGEQLLATVLAGDGSCRNASGPLRSCAVAQPSALLRVGDSYWVCAMGGATGGALFLLDTLEAIISYANMARAASQSHGIVDATLRGEGAAELAARVRMSTLQSILNSHSALDAYFSPWLTERLTTFSGSSTTALNGSHASPVGATVKVMLESGAWYREAERMVRTEFGDDAADLFLRTPASGVCNERSIEASFGRIVTGGVMVPSPDVLQYLERRAVDDMSMLKRTCTFPAVVLKGSNSRSTYDPLHEDADDSPLCGRKPMFSSIASLLLKRSDQPPAPPLEVVRAAEAFCRLMGPKLATRTVMSTYRPPPGAKPNVPQPVNRASENARICDGVFDQPPTGSGIARTYKVISRIGADNIQPGSIVVMMPRNVIEGQPYWLGEVVALTEVPDEDEFGRTFLPIRYLERFAVTSGRLFCVGKPVRVPFSRILAGVDGTLEVHQLPFRAPDRAELRLKLPSGAVTPLERVYELNEDLDASLIAVANLARSNIVAAAAEEEAERAAAQGDAEAMLEAEAEEEAARDAAAMAAQAANRAALWGMPEGPRRANREEVVRLPIRLKCTRCRDSSDHTTRNCPVKKAEKEAAAAIAAAAAAAAEAAAAGPYELLVRARTEGNKQVMARLGLGKGLPL